MADSSSDGIRGYNKQNIEGLSGQIKTAYSNCVNGVVDILKTEVVDKIAKCWCSPEACQFFGNEEALPEGYEYDKTKSLKEVVRLTSDDIYGYFVQFKKSIEVAYTVWYNNTGGNNREVHVEENHYAYATGGTAITLDSFDKEELDLNVSSIKADEDGNVFLSPQEVRAIAGTLGDVETQIKNKMTEQKNELDADTSFLGGGQAEAIETCFGKLLEKVSEIFKWLTTGEDGNLAETFEQVVQKYEKVAESIADSYNSASYDDAASN